MAFIKSQFLIGMVLPNETVTAKVTTNMVSIPYRYGTPQF